jgi:hypothetical protein
MLLESSVTNFSLELTYLDHDLVAFDDLFIQSDLYFAHVFVNIIFHDVLFNIDMGRSILEGEILVEF